MNSISWQTTPAIKNTVTEQVRSFLQKLSALRSRIILIDVQLLSLTLKYLVYNLSGQITFKLLGDLAVRTLLNTMNLGTKVISKVNTFSSND